MIFIQMDHVGLLGSDLKCLCFCLLVPFLILTLGSGLLCFEVFTQTLWFPAHRRLSTEKPTCT
jgi:hypothetical protein